jgi:hypothetical protein
MKKAFALVEITNFQVNFCENLQKKKKKKNPLVETYKPTKKKTNNWLKAKP